MGRQMTCPLGNVAQGSSAAAPGAVRVERAQLLRVAPLALRRRSLRWQPAVGAWREPRHRHLLGDDLLQRITGPIFVGFSCKNQENIRKGGKGVNKSEKQGVFIHQLHLPHMLPYMYVLYDMDRA